MNMYSRLVVITVLMMTGIATGVERPWEIFIDPISGNECGIINAGNMELVQLTGTGSVIAVRGTDVQLSEYAIDENGNVYYQNELLGFIAYAYDGDGYRTLWWVNTLGTNTYDLDLETGEPTLSDNGPTDYVGVGCDACVFWDDPSVCPDDSGNTTSPIASLCGSGATQALAMTLIGLGLGRMRSRMRLS